MRSNTLCQFQLGSFIVVNVKLKTQPFVRDGTKDCFNRTSTIKKIVTTKVLTDNFVLVVF